MSPTNPTEATELAALEAALAKDPSADAEWLALIADVRDDAPEPRRQFERDLRRKVETGFPRERPARLRLLPRARPALAGFACLAMLCTVVGIAVSANGGAGGELPAASGAGTASVEREATAPAAADSTTSGIDLAPSPVRPGVAAAPQGGLTSAPASPPRGFTARARKVERTTSLGLRTDARGLQDAADAIVRATQDLGGVVETSRVDSGAGGGTATFVLRVPTARLDDALKRFGELADVRRLTQTAEDVTGAFVSAQDRLSDARAERRALLQALGVASTEARISSLRRRIADSRRAIARLEGDLRGLRRRTDTARIDVSLRASGSRGTGAREEDGGAWGPGDAARDALRVLEVAAGVLLVALAVLGPAGLLLGGGAAAAGALRRRRRDGALGTG